MIRALSAGALVGLGVFLLVRALHPPRPSLAMVLAQAAAGAPPPPVASLGPSARWAARWSARVGPPLERAMERWGVTVGDLGADLAVIGRSVPDHMALRAAAATAGVALVAAVTGLAGASGARVSGLLAVWVCVLAGLLGFVVPDAVARRQAVRRREAFRQSLAFFLDLVIVVLAGGAGVNGALRQAAAAGDGWAYLQIRNALSGAQLRREPQWTVLGQLGAELGIEELEQLAAQVALAEREGASVRQSLAAKAASIRDHELAEAEAKAASATVRMSAPLVLLGMAFCIFILYGAASTVGVAG